MSTKEPQKEQPPSQQQPPQQPQSKKMDVEESKNEKQENVKKVNLSSIKSKQDAETLLTTYMEELKEQKIDPWNCDVDTLNTITTIKQLVKKFQEKEINYVKDLESTGMNLDKTILDSVVSPPPTENGQKFAKKNFFFLLVSINNSKNE